MPGVGQACPGAENVEDMDPAHFLTVVRGLTDGESRVRERSADEVTDWLSSCDPVEVSALATTLAAAAATEEDPAALEAQLHAILELGATGHVLPAHVRSLRQIDVQALSAGLQEYVIDLLDADAARTREMTKLVGFYREMSEGEFPYEEGIPRSGSGDGQYPAEDVARYLLSGHPVLDVMEVTTDVIGSQFRVPGGSSVLTDGSHVWRLDLAHYVRCHFIALPRNFVQFMTERNHHVPYVTQSALIAIAWEVNRTLGFRPDSGSATGNRELGG
jgi:hypothetical protein